MLYQLDEIMQESPNALSSLESKLKSYLFGNGIVQIQGNSMIIGDTIFAEAILGNSSNENYVTEECVEGFNLGRAIRKATKSVGKTVQKGVFDPFRQLRDNVLGRLDKTINGTVDKVNNSIDEAMSKVEEKLNSKLSEAAKRYKAQSEGLMNGIKSDGQALVKNQKKSQRELFFKAASKMNDVKNNAILYGIAGFILCIIIATYTQGNPFSRIGGVMSELVDRIKKKADEGSLLDNLGDIISDVLKTIGRVIAENIIFIAGMVVLIYGIKRYVIEHTKNTAAELIDDEKEALSSDGIKFVDSIMNRIVVNVPEQ